MGKREITVWSLEITSREAFRPSRAVEDGRRIIR